MYAELFHGGDAPGSEMQHQSFTCPICGRLGFTESNLQEHVNIEHPDSAVEVVSDFTSNYNQLLVVIIN